MAHLATPDRATKDPRRRHAERSVGSGSFGRTRASPAHHTACGLRMTVPPLLSTEHWALGTPLHLTLPSNRSHRSHPFCIASRLAGDASAASPARMKAWPAPG